MNANMIYPRAVIHPIQCR